MDLFDPVPFLFLHSDEQSAWTVSLYPYISMYGRCCWRRRRLGRQQQTAHTQSEQSVQHSVRCRQWWNLPSTGTWLWSVNRRFAGGGVAVAR